ncbi:transposase [Metarhizium robertsii ARSEF 23]|uniref:Transposase n=1 Tax=Metarhizium robertsii (strain ARSEF 23 / ATCC MYA-3075) TaxID=655844 RepID=E9EJ49_METRA|nr:transposase [Metarhizium robertsii ARSEF 23]EFZ03326.2 transposase [Metarhizium robertsii ARSEF 23]
MPTNRGSATAIEVISAGGSHTPAFLILTGAVHQSAFYRIPELHDDAVIAVSTSGFTNDEPSLEWLNHFDKHTAQKTTGQYRLLIIDGHGSDHTVEFIQYADDNTLDILVRDGCLHITKSEFLATIESVRGQALKAPTIQSAFRKTGIVSWNPKPILDQIQALHPTSPREVTTPPPNNWSSSPFDAPYILRHLNNAASKIEDIQEAMGELQPALKTEMDRLIRGAVVQSAELRQTMKGLARTKMAEDLRKQRKVGRNRLLQSKGARGWGGSLRYLTAVEWFGSLKKRS